MDGKEVFDGPCASSSIRRRGHEDRRRQSDDINLVIPHQANVRIIKAATSASAFPWSEPSSPGSLRQHVEFINSARLLRRA